LALAMEATQPRYEWRAWAERLGDVADRIRAVSDCHERSTTAEVYIVSRAAGANPKVRSDRLDLKVLRAVEDGFQQWGVALKVPFPVQARSLDEEVFPLLGVAGLPLLREAYTADQLFDEVVRPHPHLIDVEVKKHREFYSVSGCDAEVVAVTIAGRALHSAAVESVDLDALREARRVTGMNRYENVDYPEMIRRALGWGAD
jgi:hypothetical protein